MTEESTGNTTGKKEETTDAIPDRKWITDRVTEETTAGTTGRMTGEMTGRKTEKTTEKTSSTGATRTDAR